MTNESLAQAIANILATREEKVVFAESCTGGLLSGALAKIPGVSANLCGSAVTYRVSIKEGWLRVKRSTIKAHTTESRQVADEMVLGVLKNCPEADWAVSVVGHMGPDAPIDKDGEIFASFARRTKKGKLKIKDRLQYQCGCKDRVRRIDEAIEAVLSQYARLLHKREHEDPKTFRPVAITKPKLAVATTPPVTATTPTKPKRTVPKKIIKKRTPPKDE